MIIDLSNLLDDSEKFSKFTGEIDQSEISFPDREIKFNKPIDYEADLFVLDDGEVEFSLRINYSYTEPCSRCLKSTESSKEIRISGKMVEGNEEDSLEEDEDNLIFYENHEFNIVNYIKTQIYISLPMKILCDENCKGLCSSCGIDLNENTCDCVEHTIDPRLLELQKFFPKE